MLETVRKILTNILQSLYQSLFYAVIMAVLVMFFYMYIEKFEGDTFAARMRQAFVEWKNRFARAKSFRRLFYLALVVVLVMFKTLFNRNIWGNPLSGVIGIWGFHNAEGKFTTEVVENFVLFIPLMFFILFYLETTRYQITKVSGIILKSIAISFAISFVIEFLQLMLHIGTWQLSDLFFNTMGGLAGGLIYVVYYLIRGKKNIDEKQ